MYPFGEGCMAWCDMNQQSLPFLMELKDMLSGKDGLLFSMHNAGGMNFWGVFCFFLSSPFSFITALVPKEDMIFFVNIIVVIKLALCSLTAAIYFRLCKKRLSGSLAIPLSMMYAFCGYGMLFFQNLMWLDVMYVFPLLMIGLHRLTKKKKPLMYFIALTASVVLNFYLSYMVIAFTLLYMGVYLINNRKAPDCREVCIRYIGSSLLSALLSAVIWLPCLIQVIRSARLSSVYDNLTGSRFFSSYETVLPLLFCTGLILAIPAASVLRRGGISAERKGFLILYLLTLIPFFIEPVNIMWHTGNYAAFPARYGFITVFLGLICCGDLISDTSGEISGKHKWLRIYISLIISSAMIYAYYFISKKLIDKDFETLSKYTATLWGDKDSLYGLTLLLVLSVICCLSLWFLYRKHIMLRQIFALSLTLLCCFEGMNSIRIYMVSPAEKNPKRTEDFLDLIELHDRIDDDDFYRVSMDQKSSYYNIAGALGYSSISHYSSLTDRDFMDMHKLLGLTTVWMKTGSKGGTELTDALFSIKYRIDEISKKNDRTVFSTENYALNQTEFALGLGILCGSDLSDCESIPAGLSRAEIQQYIFERVFGSSKKLITEYDCMKKYSDNITFSDGRYILQKGNELFYSFYVKGRQSLYAECFDNPADGEAVTSYGLLRVKINGITKGTDYPSADNNGLLSLGVFENERVIVEINCEKDMKCTSFGVFGLDLDVLSAETDNTACAGLKYIGGRLAGSVSTNSPSVCLLSIPYNRGLSVKVNGKEVSYRRVFSDLTAIDLDAGVSEIEISFIPEGFIAGLLISAVGIVRDFAGIFADFKREGDAAARPAHVRRPGDPGLPRSRQRQKTESHDHRRGCRL